MIWNFFKNDTMPKVAPNSMRGHFGEKTGKVAYFEPTHPGHDYLSDPTEDPGENQYISLGGPLTFGPPL
jgi:hypothetical protein